MDIATKFIANPHEFGVALTQDAEPVLREVEQYRQASPRRSKEMYLKASFPMVLVKSYMIDKGITFEEFLNNKEHIKNMCNDYALSKFKVSD